MTRQEATAKAKAMKVGDNSIIVLPNYTLVKVGRNAYKVGVVDVDGGYWRSRMDLDAALTWIYSR